jgi:hypothetical protein
VGNGRLRGETIDQLMLISTKSTVLTIREEEKLQPHGMAARKTASALPPRASIVDPSTKPRAKAFHRRNETQ